MSQDKPTSLKKNKVAEKAKNLRANLLRRKQAKKANETKKNEQN